MIAEMNKVGIDGGFWTKSHRAGFVAYPRMWNKLHICHSTLRGPARIKGRAFERRIGGGGGNGMIVIQGLSSRPGWGVDSRHRTC